MVSSRRARGRRSTDGGATDDDGRTDGDDDDDDDDDGGGGGADARVDRAWVERGRADGGDATRARMADGGARERERGGQVSSAVRANEARGEGRGGRRARDGTAAGARGGGVGPRRGKGATMRDDDFLALKFFRAETDERGRREACVSIDVERCERMDD